MIQEIEASTKRLSIRRSHGRVANAVAAMLRQYLSVPRIYLKPRIPGYSGIDVLAVDRAGSGDVHGIEIKVSPILPTRAALRPMLKAISAMPIHFRYFAFNSAGMNVEVLRKLADYDELFDPSGIGRVGIIAYDDVLLARDAIFDPKLVSILIRPERYLLRGEKLSALEKYLRNTKPDMEVRTG